MLRPPQGDIDASSPAAETTPILVTAHLICGEVTASMTTENHDYAIVFANGYGNHQGPGHGGSKFDWTPQLMANLVDAGFTHVLATDHDMRVDDHFQRLRDAGLAPMLDFSDYRKESAEDTAAVTAQLTHYVEAMAPDRLKYLASGEATDGSAPGLMNYWSDLAATPSPPWDQAHSSINITHGHDVPVSANCLSLLSGIQNLGINVEVSNDRWPSTKQSLEALHQGTSTQVGRPYNELFLTTLVKLDHAHLVPNLAAQAFGIRTLFYLVVGANAHQFFLHKELTGTEKAVQSLNLDAVNLFKALPTGSFQEVRETHLFANDDCAVIETRKPDQTLLIGKYAWSPAPNTKHYWFYVANLSPDTVRYDVRFRRELEHDPGYHIQSVDGRGVAREPYKAGASMEGTRATTWRITYSK